MKMDKNEALYLFVSGKKLLASDKQMSEIYKENMDTDGFLYVQYKEEMVYGWMVSVCVHLHTYL